MKNITLTIILSIVFAGTILAQTPNYLPTNGLIGWWPFNGNCNDESGNGNNGIAVGATLTTDRLGITNSAYNLNGGTHNITINNAFFNVGWSEYTISGWFNSDDVTQGNQDVFNTIPHNGIAIDFNFVTNPNKLSCYLNSNPTAANSWNISTIGSSFHQFQSNEWYNWVFQKKGNHYSLYINSVLDTTFTGSIAPINYNCGVKLGQISVVNAQYFHGKLDDYGIWNRALTPSEIKAIYSACPHSFTKQPTSLTANTKNNIQFDAIANDAEAAYQWQTDFGLGYQNLKNINQYNGATTSTLTVSNLKINNHLQPFRVIANSASCSDTSNIVNIHINDTCITTDTKTVTISVHDTLVINVNLTEIAAPNNINTLKVYPNPSNDHMTIDFGNFATMIGYTIKIINNLGQDVYAAPVTKQFDSIDLSTWSGGLYFLHIKDASGNLLENKKIVLE